MNRHGILDELVRELAGLPGIGRKTAQRLAFHILKQPCEDTDRLVQAIRAVKERLGLCRQCRNIAEGELCDICLDPSRDATRLVVVEDVTTLLTFERTGGYKGLYHVLAGALSPLDGVGPADIKAQDFVDRIAQSKVEEVIVATSPTIEGEATAIYLSRLIRPLGICISRIACGVPVGMDLEYADEVTLIKSLDGRRAI
ncbi:MAG: recombination protein RecR [Nitrospiraceae bacterium]|nr:MAG: recombination protein RecR [Nitrospiraceae bacterium]